jgi:hypothetical protein
LLLQKEEARIAEEKAREEANEKMQKQLQESMQKKQRHATKMKEAGIEICPICRERLPSFHFQLACRV